MIDAAPDEIDLDYARAIADRANRYMALHAIAPTPENFAIWFSYSRGDAPELKRTIDVLIAGKKRFDAATSRELHKTYIASSLAAEMAGELPEQFRSVMTEASHYVSDAIADNQTQIIAMDEMADQARSGIDPKHLVKRLMGELNNAATRSAQLQSNLSETSRELDVIRVSLNHAEQRANTDTLTGLPNRRAFEEYLRTAQIEAMEGGLPLGLLMIDIDHGVGDQVLRLIATTLRDRLRENDLPARYGGEELIAVLPGATLAVCEAVGERIRRSIAECRLTRRSTGETLPGVTVSIGIAQFRFGESIAQLIERCDEALYLAKRTGRNRMVTELRVEEGSVV
jgi:diguanylate cyclase